MPVIEFEAVSFKDQADALIAEAEMLLIEGEIVNE